MKRLDIPIQVLCENNLPKRFKRQNKTYSVERVENRWKLRGKWWIAEEDRHYFRIQTQFGQALIYHRSGKKVTDEWILAEIFD